jgi:uncharacterized protein (TIGR03067 family)
MLRLAALLCVLSGAVALAAPAPLPRRTKAGTVDDLQRMQGEWIVTRRTVGGSEISSPDMTAVIQGDRIKFLLKGEVRTEWTITLDVTRRPKLFDRRRVAGVGKGGDITLRGIYKLEGDTLTVCYHSSSTSQERPRDFTAARSGEWLSVMKRKQT